MYLTFLGLKIRDIERNTTHFFYANLPKAFSHFWRRHPSGVSAVYICSYVLVLSQNRYRIPERLNPLLRVCHPLKEPKRIWLKDHDNLPRPSPLRHTTHIVKVPVTRWCTARRILSNVAVGYRVYDQYRCKIRVLRWEAFHLLSHIASYAWPSVIVVE